MTKPITPDEVDGQKAAQIPDPVFVAFNDLIARHWDGYEAVVRQKDILEKICRTLQVDETTVLLRHYLDVEGTYRDAGWDVTYDKPGIGEAYDPFFTFRRNKDRA